MADYRVDVYDTSGNKQAELVDFEFITLTKQVNQPGLLKLGISGEHWLLDSLQDKWVFEVMRKPSGYDWQREFVGIYRWFKWQHGSRPTAEVVCDGLLSKLGWRIVAWTAGYTNRSQFTSQAAETIANTLVYYNAGAGALQTNGRLRDGVISGLGVETNQGGGNTLDWYCAYSNLLNTLQDLAKIGGGDFDLVRTGSTTCEWRWYSGQLGSDKTADIVFAMERGNMANPVYTDDRRKEKTVAVVGGQGEENDRQVVVRQGSNYSSNNDIEVFVAATDVATTAGLQVRGDQKLDELKAVQGFDFEVLQTEAYKYGVNYQMGDLVTAINPYNGQSATMKVDAVAIALDRDGKETIEVDVVNV